MNTLTIKNFGPIKNVSLNLKKVNLLIGTQGSGKSTIAKILSIMNDPNLITANTINKLLVDYNINYEINANTLIEYKTPQVKITIKENQIEHSLNKAIKEIETEALDLSNIKMSENDLNEVMNILVKFTELENAAFEQNLLKDAHITTLDKPNEVQEYIRIVLPLSLLGIKMSELYLNSCIYIPAERNFFALLAENIFSLGENMKVLPKCIWKFGSHYEQAIKMLQNNEVVNIPFIEDLQFLRNGEENQIIYKGVSNSLIQCSSGFQSSIPLAIVCLYNKNRDKSLFIIEEPEQNLYPVTQYNLVKFLAENCLKQDNKLLITTHSPYILTSFINLIQAHSSGAVNPELTSQLIPETQWIDFNDVSAYFIDKGQAKDILDYEEQTIFAEEIDNASSHIAEEYDQLLEIAYPNR